MHPTRLRNKVIQRSAAAILFTLVAGVAISTSAVSCKENVNTNQPGTGGGGGQGPELTPRELYVQNVHPELLQTCGICHTSTANCTPKFMEETAEASYELIKNYVRAEDGAPGGLVTYAENSNLIYHGAHTGPALSEVQEVIVREWLDAEYNPDEVPHPTLNEALNEIGECMRTQQLKDAFTNEGVYLLAYHPSEHGPCGSCHNTGQAGAWISYYEDEMQVQNSRQPWIKRLIQPRYEGDDVFAGLVASNRFVRKVEDAAACGSSHPAAWMEVAVEQGITDYVAAALDRWATGPCDVE